jgi:hypothetical protein
MKFTLMVLLDCCYICSMDMPLSIYRFLVLWKLRTYAWWNFFPWSCRYFWSYTWIFFRLNLYSYLHTRPVIIMLKLVLFQFVSQRQRQIRGSALKLLMDYIRTFPCKVNLLIWDCVGPNNIIQFNHFHFLKLLPVSMWQSRVSVS